MLKPHKWNAWITLTFPSRLSEEKAGKKFKKWLHEVNKKIYGKRYRKSKGQKGVMYYATMERQPISGNPHFHLVLCLPPVSLAAINKQFQPHKPTDLRTFSKLEKIMEEKWKKAGGGKTHFVEYQKQTQEYQNNIMAYCSKGDVFFERLERK